MHFRERSVGKLFSVRTYRKLLGTLKRESIDRTRLLALPSFWQLRAEEKSSHRIPGETCSVRSCQSQKLSIGSGREVVGFLAIVLRLPDPTGIPIKYDQIPIAFHWFLGDSEDIRTEIRPSDRIFWDPSLDLCFQVPSIFWCFSPGPGSDFST